MTLPLGFPTRGTVSSARAPAVITCQIPGCGADVTVIVLHFVQAEDQQLHTFCHQFCDQHAAENEEVMRSVYTVKPLATIWR